MTEINLYAWSKKYGVVYSRAQKLVNEGVLKVERKNNNVMIDDATLPPVVDMVKCMICDKELPQITGSHLKLHQTTVQDYKRQFPDVKIVSSEISKKISDTAKNMVRDEVYRDNVSKGRSGIIPKNHPRFQKGYYTPTEATKQIWREQRKGHFVSEETKKKIGDAHRGVPETEEAKKNYQAGLRKYYETHDSTFKGKEHTNEAKKIMSEKALIREEYLSLEIKQKRGYAIRGIKRTDEQRENYKKGRIAYMKAHPHTLKPSKAELIMGKWLEDHGIYYQTQYFIEKHPYDFYLPEYKALIEMDGAHHWDNYWIRTNSAEHNLDVQMEKDAVENLIAGRLGYQIYRILYRIIPGDAPEWGTLMEQLEQQEFFKLINTKSA